MPASNSPERNILIIDDEPAARYAVAGFLRAENCVTYEAQNGVEGLRMAREIKPQLVLVDLHMPGMSGYDVLDHSKPTRSCARFPRRWSHRQLSPTGKDAILNTKPASSSTKALFRASVCTGCWTWCCGKPRGGWKSGAMELTNWMME
jgi:CheY-like chemotaxis protein